MRATGSFAMTHRVRARFAGLRNRTAVALAGVIAGSIALPLAASAPTMTATSAQLAKHLSPSSTTLAGAGWSAPVAHLAGAGWSLPIRAPKPDGAGWS